MSFANNQVFGDDITTTYGSAVYPLGTERLVLGSQTGVGDQVYVFVFNNTAADYAIGQVIGAKAATTSLGTTVLAPTSSPAIRVIGVAQSVLPFATTTSTTGVVLSGPYGWVLKRGIGSVLTGTGAITADNAIVVDSTDAGTAMNASALGAATKFDVVIGYAHTTAAATALSTAYLSCRA
jgi:hypothetical protein